MTHPRYRLSDIISKAIDQTKIGGNSESAVALALIAIAIAIDESGDNVATAIEGAAK